MDQFFSSSCPWSPRFGTYTPPAKPKPLNTSAAAAYQNRCLVQDELLIIGDYTFSAIFIAELLAKWLALSIPTYFKDNWNW